MSFLWRFCENASCLFPLVLSKLRVKPVTMFSWRCRCSTCVRRLHNDDDLCRWGEEREKISRGQWKPPEAARVSVDMFISLEHQSSLICDGFLLIFLFWKFSIVAQVGLFSLWLFQSWHGDPRVWRNQKPEAGLHVSQRPAGQGDALLCWVSVRGHPEVGGGGHLCPLRRAHLRLAHELREEELSRREQGQTASG